MCLLFTQNLEANNSPQPQPSTPRSIAAAKSVTPNLITELRNRDLAFGSPIFIRIFKKESELELWVEKDSGGFSLFKTYRICNFSGDLGPKTKQGDRQSPEGFYFVNASRMNPWSRFHLSFNPGYPNTYDKAHGYTGNALMIHGNCVSIGCYSMTDERVEEIYTMADAALRNGQPFFRVHSFPFRMTDAALKKYSEHRWFDFWKNLKVGFDLFETHKRPPNVTVENKRYVFN